MKKSKIMTTLVVLAVLLVTSFGVVFADEEYNTEFEAGSGQNLFLADGHSHSYNRYILEGKGYAYCVEATVNYHRNRTYKKIGQLGPEFSWAIYNIENEEYKQAVIWALTGSTIESESPNGNVDLVYQLANQARASVGQEPPGASVTKSGDFTYRRSDNKYVSGNVHVENGGNPRLEGAPEGSQIVDNGGGNYVVLVPADKIVQDTDITFRVDGTGQAWVYDNADVWGDGVNQNVATGNRHMGGGAGATMTIHVTAVGDMKVYKEDEHGKPIQGASFRVTGGPDNINRLIVTDANGNAELLEQRVGTYNIKEEDVPPTLVLNKNTFTITIKSGTSVSYTVVDQYERGELGLKKEDILKQLNKVNYGDGDFEEIEVGLFAAENIFEGTTQVLTADQPIATRTFNAKGDEVTVKEFTREDGKYFDGLPLGKYYWKELNTNTSYLMPAQATIPQAQKVKYEQTITYVNKDVEFVPKQTTTMYDQEVYGRVIVYKSDADNSNLSGANDTDENPAKGAVLRLTLKSNYNYETKQPIDASHDTYTAEVDKYGRAEFIDKDFETKFAGTGIDMTCTIPFGNYVLDEIKTSDNGNSYYYGIQDTEVGVIENQKAYTVLVKDEAIPVFLELVKRDKDDDDLNGSTHEIVKLSGAGFKIWDCQRGDWLVQAIPTTGEKIDTYITNNQGTLITPEKVFAGKYVIYEVESPIGYYLDESYRLPMDENGNVIESQLGKEEFGGKAVDIKNISVGVSDAEEYPEGEGILDVEFISNNLKITFTFEDNTLRGNIDIYKEGELFTKVDTTTSRKYEDDGYDAELTEYAPHYEYGPLEGAKFEVSPLEDITTADGRVKETAGTKHYITTGSDGHGICRNEDGTEDMLFCHPTKGTKYLVHEIYSPAGYDLEEDQVVTVYPGDNYTKVKMVKAEAKDDYIPFELKLIKDFNDVDEDGYIYRPQNELIRPDAFAIFGIYTKQDLHPINGPEIPSGSLIQTLKAVEGEDYIKTYKLPDGDYYIEELYTCDPFSIIDEQTREPHRYDFTISHTDNVKDQQQVVVGMENTIPGNLYLVKIPTTLVIKQNGLIVKAPELFADEIEDAIKSMTSEAIDQFISGEITVEEFARKTTLDGFTLVESAEYKIYVDEACTIPLQKSKDGQSFEDIVITSEKDEDNKLMGLYKLENVPVGVYYLKEVKAPVYRDSNGSLHYYEVQKDPVEVYVNEDEIFETNLADNTVFKILHDASVYATIEKTDIFTAEGIPDCLFSITDKNGKELVRFVTDAEGHCNIPTDIFEDGEKYYFTELDAPKYPYYDGDVLYELNTEPHEFIAHVDEDGKWLLWEEDEEGNLIKNDKINIVNYRTRTTVELQKLDMMDSTAIPNCKFILKGIDTDFVEEGVTDENGVYIFRDVPYGKYTYTELEAPEGWMIDTTPHEFTLDSHGTKLVVYDERKVDLPDTGDIAVIAIVCVAVVSVAGIAFVVIKNKKGKASK